MIRFLYTLKQELKERDIYLWDIGKSALWTFYSMISREIDIHALVTNYPSYFGETFLNRPVLPVDSLLGNAKALIIISEETSSPSQQLVERYGDCMRWPDALELNPALLGKSVYLYGPEDRKWNFIRDADKRGITIRGFLTEEARPGQKILGLPVLKPEDAAKLGDADVIVLRQPRTHDMQIVDALQDAGFEGNLYLEELANPEDMWAFDPCIMLDNALKHSLRILFCCEDRMGRELFHRIFALYGISVDREVQYEGSARDNPENIWALADEDPKTSVLLIHSFSERRRYEIVEAANDLGYSAGDHNYAATNIACYNRLRYSHVLSYEFDTKLGFSIDYSVIGGLPGWAVYGDGSTAEKRIMVLGGSTSSEVYYPENWVSKLHRKLCAEGKKAVIFNGAHEANDVFQEFSRLVRDIHALKPDIVISLGGYNDTTFKNDKFDNARGEHPFDYWHRIESYMKQISESEGAAFYAVLQPVNKSPDYTSLYDTLMYLKFAHHRAAAFSERLRSDDFYTNLFSSFLYQNNLFIDMCHYSEEGNKHLADIVYELIKGEFK